MLLHVWKDLITRHGADNVPDLVFVGRYGWEIDDLRAEIGRTNFLWGKLKIHEALTDQELRNAYSGCMFTVFPSFCEGHGLPVSESLVSGRYCIASNATSIPEVGGPFVDYFDPTDLAEAVRLVERALFEPGYLEAREDRIARQYRPPQWRDAAADIVEFLKTDFDAKTGLVS